MEAYQTISDKLVSLEEIPNLLPITKVTPKMNNENVRVTQVHCSMEGKKYWKRFCQSRTTKPKRSKIIKKENPSNNIKSRHSINIKKNVHVARMFVQQLSFDNARVAIMF